MIGTGKYDFPGIRKAGAAALKAVLATTSWGAALVAGPFSGTANLIEEWLSEWLANKGLLIINVGVIYEDGAFDQKNFDNAMENALSKVQAQGLTDAQKKVIDDQVIKAFRPFALVAKPSRK